MNKRFYTLLGLTLQNNYLIHTFDKNDILINLKHKYLEDNSFAL